MGIDGFGLYSFIFYVIWLGVVFSDYGFDLSATKQIALHNENRQKLDEIFSAVLIIKLTISMLFLGVLTLLIFIVERFSENALLYYLAFGFVIGQAIFPVWFYQGIEKMRYITIFNAISKFIFTLLIFLFVKSIDDLYLVFVFNALGSIFAGLIALYIAKKQFNITLKLQSFSTLMYYLKDGWYIFTSRIAVELYTSVNIIILGFFVNNTVLGYFSIVEKIIRALGNILEPLTRATYPYLNKVYQDSKVAFYKKNMQLSMLIFIIMAPLSYIVNVYGVEILSLISGDVPDSNMVHLLYIFSFLLVIYLYGSQFTNVLVTVGESKLLNKIVIVAVIINFLIAPPIIYFTGVEGFAWLNVVIAFFISITKGYYVFIKFRSRDICQQS
ncbi:MAG: oligosaccharide flippase family protein [Epsilonproteobacteria bacterium]|nr:oligosaccharide flippase family protein [Campylobacterota bacterium]